jgi:ribosomal protein L11 methyltransferase
MAWPRLITRVAAHHADRVAAIFEANGAVAVTVSGAGEEIVVEPLPGTTPYWDDVVLEGMFEPGVDAAELGARIIGDCDACGVRAVHVSVDRLEDRDWSSTWREFAAPMTFAGRLTIVPRDWTQPTEGRVMRLDPGLAFGTGSHPTTALCLEWLARQDLDGRSMVDFGCGSGVLSVAARLLGAAHVTAVDHDPQALRATTDNAACNGLHGTQCGIAVVAPQSLRLDSRDIVVANILADALVALVLTLSALVRPGGRILLSGIRVEQLEQVVSVYTGFDFEPPCEREGWIAIEGTRARA